MSMLASVGCYMAQFDIVVWMQECRQWICFMFIHLTKNIQHTWFIFHEHNIWCSVLYTQRHIVVWIQDVMLSHEGYIFSGNRSAPSIFSLLFIQLLLIIFTHAYQGYFMATGWSHDCLSTSEETLNYIGNWAAKITQNSLQCWTNRTHSNALSIFDLYFLDMQASVMCAIWLSLILWSGCWKSQGIYFTRLYIC